VTEKKSKGGSPKMETVEDMERELQCMADETEARRKEQLAVDMRALVDLTKEHGVGMVERLDIGRYHDGLPTMVIVSMPARDIWKRYEQQVVQSKQGTQRLKASALLASSCILYPPKDVYQELLNKQAGIHSDAAAHLIKMAQCRDEEEEKG
jgi:hypothetical protein